MLESEDRALPLSRGQLDIWLSQETGLVGAEWQLGLLVRIEGQVERVLLERAIRQAVTEAEPARAAFFEVDGQIVQRPIDHSDLELAFEDLRDSDDPAGLARKKATDIQRTLMPLTGQLLKFALYRTADDEFHLFGLCHHINLDGLGMAVVSRRVASIYTALATGEPIPPRLLRHAPGSRRLGDGLRRVRRIRRGSGVLEQQPPSGQRARLPGAPRFRRIGRLQAVRFRSDGRRHGQ